MKKEKRIENVKIILALTVIALIVLELISQFRGSSIIMSILELIIPLDTPINLPQSWVFPIQAIFISVVCYFSFRNKKRKK